MSLKAILFLFGIQESFLKMEHELYNKESLNKYKGNYLTK